VCCAVHRGTTAILSESSLHFVAFTRQIVVVRTPAFVVFLLGSLRGEAAAVLSELMNSFSVLVCMLRLLEAAQRIAAHADSRTTKLYDRRGQKLTAITPLGS
jgi:hypothetical protein